MPEADAKLLQLVQKWSEGKATLKDVRGYSDDELYAVARTGYAFFNQGKYPEARTIFQGLFAINPRDPYFARAMAVLEMASGNSDGALSAYDVALKLEPGDPLTLVGRAEILIATGQKNAAVADLKKAAAAPEGDRRLILKAKALLEALRAR